MCSKHFLNGNPTEAYPYPTENLGYTSTFKQKKKRKTLVRKESIKSKKYIYLQEHGFCVQEKTDQLSLSFGQYYIANFLLHIAGMLKIYTFIANYCYNIVHENKKKKKLLFKLYLNPINRCSRKLNS